MFKANMKTLEWQWRRPGVFIVNFEHIWHLDLVFLLLILSKKMPIGLDKLDGDRKIWATSI